MNICSSGDSNASSASQYGQVISWIGIGNLLLERLNDRVAVRALDLFKRDAQDLRGLDLGLAFRANEVQACADRFKVVLPAGGHKQKGSTAPRAFQL